MKIAIPVEDNQTEICPSFGRTSMFLIYDTETKEKKYLDNSGIAMQGGAGIKAAQVIVDEKPDRADGENQKKNIFIDYFVHLFGKERTAEHSAENEIIADDESAVEPNRLYCQSEPLVYFETDLKGVCKRMQPEKKRKRNQVPKLDSRAQNDGKNYRSYVSKKIAAEKLF